ncbi:MAG: AlpA family phage regulatory protein [Rhodocyclales bacterium]|nr:AlpA family phage regulatory protein [Rhodocyclales bacterium]
MEALLRLPQVEAITGRKKPTIYSDMKNGKFPKPVKIGARAVAWLPAEIQRWIDERPRGAA